MASTAITSQGTTIAISDGASPPAYTTIANINTWDGPTKSANDIDVTDLSSTAKEYIQGLEDEGEITMGGYYKASNTEHAQLQDNAGSNTLIGFKITLSDGSNLTFSARVSSFSLNGAVDAPVEMSLTLKVSGAVTRATS